MAYNLILIIKQSNSIVFTAIVKLYIGLFLCDILWVDYLLLYTKFHFNLESRISDSTVR